MEVMYLCVGDISTNCYIVSDKETKAAVVIDPGDRAASILLAVRENQLDVQYVLLTHGHSDHILAANEVLKETNAKYVVPKEDLWLIKKENVHAAGYVEDEPDILAEEGTEIHFGNLTAKYMSTPGHTPGSSVIQIEECLFTGDTLFKNDCGRCDLEGGNYSEMLKSLKRLHDLEGDYHVLPGHDGFSTLAEERKNNPYMKEGVASK